MLAFNSLKSLGQGQGLGSQGQGQGLTLLIEQPKTSTSSILRTCAVPERRESQRHSTSTSYTTLLKTSLSDRIKARNDRYVCIEKHNSSVLNL